MCITLMGRVDRLIDRKKERSLIRREEWQKRRRLVVRCRMQKKLFAVFRS